MAPIKITFKFDAFSGFRTLLELFLSIKRIPNRFHHFTLISEKAKKVRFTWNFTNPESFQNILIYGSAIKVHYFPGRISFLVFEKLIKVKFPKGFTFRFYFVVWIWVYARNLEPKTLSEDMGTKKDVSEPSEWLQSLLNHFKTLKNTLFGQIYGTLNMSDLTYNYETFRVSLVALLKIGNF